jgi:hypothetical protein
MPMIRCWEGNNMKKTKLLELELRKLQLVKLLHKVEQQILEVDLSIDQLIEEELISC